MTTLVMTAVLFLTTVLSVNAAPGESGFFGGVTEGIMLPKTIYQEVNLKDKGEYSLYYKEVIFITGEPIEVSGTLVVNKKDGVIDKKENGSYKETYEIMARNDDNTVQLEREITLETYFVKYEYPYGKQIKKDSTVTEWEEVITVDGTQYVVDEDLSDFNKGRNFVSFIEDHTPGITYYSGSMSNRLVYKVEDAIYADVMIEGDSYGYDQPWSKVENQSYTMTIDKKGTESWQMLIELNPFINSKKTQNYEPNSVPAISFPGTYTQIFDTKGGMDYVIKTNHPYLEKSKLKGSIYLDTTNDFEKLKIPGKLSYVNKSHFAYNDIMKLMAMSVIDESPLRYQPFEAISRGEYTLMLLKAMNITPPTDVRKSKMDDYMVFADVTPEHDLYLWLYAAKDSKLVQGRENNFFKADEPLTREEAFTLLMRVIGLEHISVDTSAITPYLDDEDIAFWARDAIYGGTALGLFKGSNGQLNPKDYVSKAEAAAIVNRLIDFLRKDMSNYYKIY